MDATDRRPATPGARTFAAAPGKNKQEFMNRNLFLTPSPSFKEKRGIRAKLNCIQEKKLTD